MHRLTNCSLLIALGLMAAVAWPRTADARTPMKRVSSRILKSRKAVRKALGKHVARQLPARFNFRKNALVWIKLTVVKKPKLRIMRVDPKRRLYMSHSSALGIVVQRKARSLVFTLSSGHPCSGGMKKHRSAMLACLRAATANAARAHQTLLLFATERARLRRVTIAHRRTPGRP